MWDAGEIILSFGKYAGNIGIVVPRLETSVPLALLVQNILDPIFLFLNRGYRKELIYHLTE